jgi:hypothetical protein
MEIKTVRLYKGKKSCDKCGAIGLYWHQSRRGNWVLFEQILTLDADSGEKLASDNRAHFAYCGDDVENPAPKKQRPPMDDDQKVAVLECVRFIAGQCDGARQNDGVGFNKHDAEFGNDLARYPSLTDNQAHAAHKMLKKYRRQLENAPANYVADARLS